MSKGRKNYRGRNNHKGGNNNWYEGINTETSLSSESGGARPKSKFTQLLEPGLTKRSIEELFSESVEQKFNSEINAGIQFYKSGIKSFSNEYLKWRLNRQFTIDALKMLVEKVHEDQLAFNYTNLFVKQINVGCRRAKPNDNSAADFIASMAALVTDVVGGVTSIAQACNVDEYIKTFNEKMEEDVVFTKPLHEARANCFTMYRNVEEIIRRYHTETFESTIVKISKSLQTEDMWLELKSARNRNSASKVFEAVDLFFNQVSKAETFNGICRSIDSYVDCNPAVMDACKSTGKALFGIYDTFGRNEKSKNSIVSRSFKEVVNNEIIWREAPEIDRLRNLVEDEEMPQAKLESKIRSAIEDLEREAKEMAHLYDSITNFVTKSTTPRAFGYSKPKEFKVEKEEYFY